jgi:hypothetical protein
MKKTRIFFWVEEIRRRREDLSDEERSRRLPIAGLDEVLVYRLEWDTHKTVCRLAASLGLSPQTVIAHLHEGLEMKRFHLK